MLPAVRQLLRDAQAATGRLYTLTSEPGVHALRVDLAQPLSQPDPLWTVTPGTLRAELIGWAHQAGYQVIWHAPTDYLLTAHAVIPGTFVEAASILVRSLDRAGSSVRITVYRKNRVLVVAGGT
ncbi:PilL domain-containing protein [mine drainage metagenome]|uniref:PilL domain-containing protein n=1 Tax=mine drainage metagenome TaxID=410659 RepID=T0ZVW7_9ZZZZ